MGVIVTLARNQSKPSGSTTPVNAMSSEESPLAEALRPYAGMLQSSDSDMVLDEDDSLRAGRTKSSKALILEKVNSVMEALLLTPDEDSDNEEDNW